MSIATTNARLPAGKVSRHCLRGGFAFCETFRRIVGKRERERENELTYALRVCAFETSSRHRVRKHARCFDENSCEWNARAFRDVFRVDPRKLIRAARTNENKKFGRGRAQLESTRHFPAIFHRLVRFPVPSPPLPRLPRSRVARHLVRSFVISQDSVHDDGGGDGGLQTPRLPS